MRRDKRFQNLKEKNTRKSEYNCKKHIPHCFLSNNWKMTNVANYDSSDLMCLITCRRIAKNFDDFAI